MADILLIGGFTLVVISGILQFMSGHFSADTAYTMKWSAKNAFIVAVVAIAIGVLIKFVEPSPEEKAAKKVAAEAAQLKEQQTQAEEAAEQAAKDAAEAQKPKVQPEEKPEETTVTPTSSTSRPQVWVVPSGKYGYYVDRDGVIDQKTVYTPGRYPVREGGRVTLISSSPETIEFLEDSGTYSRLSSYTTDGKQVMIGFVVTWSINPRNLARFKGEFGSDYKYTPVITNISRSVARDAISKTAWVSGKDSTGQWTFDRESLSNTIQSRLQAQTTAHFRGLGFGDESDKVISYGAVSLRTIDLVE